MQAEYTGSTTVTTGTVLGKVGTTGSSSTGYHLHMFMRSDGKEWTSRPGRCINPQAFFPNVTFTGSTSDKLDIITS